MALKSKKALFATLAADFGFKDPKKAVSFETYGRDTHAYLTTPANTDRVTFEYALEEKGYKVNRDYHPGSTSVDVSVSYFKAPGWDE